MKRRRIILAIVLAVGLLAGAILWLGMRPATRPAAAAPGVGFRFRDDASRAYRWSVVTRVWSGDAGAAREMSFEGHLNLRLLPGQEPRTLAAQLSPLRIRHDGQPDSKMETVYSRPFLVPIDALGAFGEARFPPDLAGGDRAVLDSAIRPFQVVLAEGSPVRWETTESDQHGQYAASYAREPGTNAVVKQKVRYTSLRQTELVSIRVTSSSMRAEIESAGFWLERAAGREQLVFEAAGGQVLARTDATFALEPLADRVPRELALWRDTELRTATAGLQASSDQQSAWDDSEEARQRRRFLEAGVTVDQLLAELPSHSPKEAQFAHDFALFLRLFPDQANQLGAKVARLQAVEASLLLNVLELAGTPQAQRVLIAVAKDPASSRDNRLRALVAIAGLEDPSADTAEQLSLLWKANRDQPESRELGASALLALGTLATRASDETGKPIVQRLEQELGTAKGPEDERALLGALANAQVKLAPDAIGPYLVSEDPGVRAAAVTLLAADESGQVQGTLLGLLEGDRAASVRGAVLKALAAQPPSEPANAAIARRLSEGREDVPALRVQMVSYLAAQMAAFPQNRVTLQAQLKREVDRQVVLAILNSLPKK